MKILLIALVVLLAVIVPNISYSESSRVLTGSGYGVTDGTVQTMSVQIPIKSMMADKAITDGAKISFGTKEYLLNNVDLSLSNKKITLNANAGDYTLSASGKLVLQANDDSIYQLSGNISNGNHFYILLKFIQEQSTTPVISGQTKKDLLILVKQTERVQWKDQYKFTVKAYDPTLNPRSDFFANTGYLQGIQITATITNPAGQILKTFSSTTQKFGNYEDSLIIPDNSRTGIYKLNVIASGNDYKTISKEFTFAVIPLH